MRQLDLGTNLLWRIQRRESVEPLQNDWENRLLCTKSPLFCLHDAFLPQGSSCIISVVAVHQIKTQETRVFSQHLMAHRLGLDVAGSKSQRAILEKELLDEWLCYLERMQLQHPDCRWIHWGSWQTLVFRCQKLMQRPVPVSADQTIDLASTLAESLSHPKPPSLLKVAALNRLIYREALQAKDERMLLSQHQYQDVVQSVACKARIIGRLTHLQMEGRLSVRKPKRQTIGIHAPSELLNTNEAAALCGVSRATWYRLLAGMQVPQAIKLGRRSVWDARELRLWIAARCPRYHLWSKQRQRLGITSSLRTDISEAIAASADTAPPRRRRPPARIAPPPRIDVPPAATGQAS
jgi:predicted DNA-binding transcriptional regulator AlpA